MKNNDKKLDAKLRVGYGVAGLSTSLPFGILVAFGMVFFTDVIGFSPAFAGILVGLGTVWDAITDPLIGRLSDNAKSKEGRRRVFLKYGAIPFGLVTWLLFTGFDLSPGLEKVYFVVIILAFYTMQTVIDVPYTSLGAEITTDYDERTRLNGTRNYFTTLGAIIQACTLSGVFYVAQYTSTLKVAWSIVAGIAAIISTICIFISYKSTKGYGRELPPEKKDKKQRSYFQAVKHMIMNKAFNRVIIFYTLFVLGVTIINSTLVYYFIYGLGLTDNQITLCLLAVFVPGLIYVPIISKLSFLTSKKVAWVICLAIEGLAMLCFMPFMSAETPFWVIILWNAICGVGPTAQYQLMWSLVGDAVEVDEFKTGERNEGTYFGVMTFLQKAAAGLVMMACGAVLTQIGYVPNVEQTPEVILGIRNFIMFGVSGFCALSIIVVFFHPVNRKTHNALTDAIRKKNNGEEYSTKDFEKLL